MANVKKNVKTSSKSSKTKPKKDNNVKVEAKKTTVTKKKDTNKKNNTKTYEKLSCIIVGLMIILLIILVIKSIIFLPSLLIFIGLELFSIAYYYIDNKSKKSLVYGLFEIGVFLVIIAIIYTIVKVI